MLVIEFASPEVLVQTRCCVAETKAELETKKQEKQKNDVDLSAKPKKKAKKGGCC